MIGSARCIAISAHAYPDGDAVGPAYAPLYPTVPRAARADRGLYDRLALFDLARGGRVREREWARRRLEELP